MSVYDGTRSQYSMEKRFEFGENWKSFLRDLNSEKEEAAEQSLKEMLDVNHLDGKSFLDIGCGSGLFSLSAKRLGADVYAFDYDEQSVLCVRFLKAKYYDGDLSWQISEGSILDKSYLRNLGTYDVVYSWGVLHHTGDMWSAINNVNGLVRPGGLLYLALYNDQGKISRYWKAIKKFYNKRKMARPLLILIYAPYFIGLRYAVRLVTRREKLERGMSYWHDMIDWIGGFPFEVATPEEIVEYYTGHGFSILKIKLCGKRSGCNEFLLMRNTTSFAESNLP